LDRSKTLKCYGNLFRQQKASWFEAFAWNHECIDSNEGLPPEFGKIDAKMMLSSRHAP
jgi:hypothetical protein